MSHVTTGARVMAAAALLAAFAGLANGQSGPPPAPVTVAEVTRGNVRATATATGTVVSRSDARIAAEVPGRLVWVAEAGDEVARGAPVARVDTESLELERRENETHVRRLGANADLLETQLARLTALGDGIASASQVDEARARLAMARQEAEQARVALDRTRHRIARAVIRAPFPGHVVERIRQPGEFVEPGAEVLRLTDTGNVEVVARAPVNEATHLAVGDPVTVHQGARATPSRIRAIVPVGDERSRMLEVRVTPGEAGWTIGSAVRVGLPAADGARAVVVPRDAVIVRATEVYVYRVGKDQVAERVPVRLGAGDVSRVEVLDGLQAGDRVVVRGGERLRDGQAVRVATGLAVAGKS